MQPLWPGKRQGTDRLKIDSKGVLNSYVSFIKMSGMNQIIGALKEAAGRGCKIRVLTTTYLGVTEMTAVDRIAGIDGAEVRISYDPRSTRLHAKAYMFRRKTGFDTAFIGSSNLSKAALNEGMEWNVKMTSEDVPQVLRRIGHMFYEYWNSSDFEPYDPDSETDRARLRESL